MDKEQFKQEMLKIAEYWFGEDNYIISEKVADRRNYIHLDCLFPDKVIKNSKGQKHNILGFILRISFYTDETGLIRYFSLTGYRKKLSSIEAYNGYAFSHLSSIGSSNFCFGSGPLSNVISVFMSTCFNKLDEKALKTQFDRFFVLFNGYLEWESLEGGPYANMPTTNNGNPRQYDANVVKMIKQRLLNYYKQNPQEFALYKNSSFSFSCDKMRIFETLKKENFKSYHTYIDRNKQGVPIQQELTINTTYQYAWGDKMYDTEVFYERQDLSKFEKGVPFNICSLVGNNIEDEINSFFRYEYEQ